MTESGSPRLVRSLTNYRNALARLREALAIEDRSPIVMDGTLQRFEFTFELAWKTMKRFLEAEGAQPGTPRDVLRRASEAGWIDDEAVWLQMLKDRNTASHVYSQQQAAEIVARLPAAADQLSALVQVLERRQEP